MRRLDWFLAAVVVSFLIGAVVVEAAGSAVAGLGFGALRPIESPDISLRRLAGHLPAALPPSGPR